MAVTDNKVNSAQSQTNSASAREPEMRRHYEGTSVSARRWRSHLRLGVPNLFPIINFSHPFFLLGHRGGAAREIQKYCISRLSEISDSSAGSTPWLAFSQSWIPPRDNLKFSTLHWPGFLEGFRFFSARSWKLTESATTDLRGICYRSAKRINCCPVKRYFLY